MNKCMPTGVHPAPKKPKVYIAGPMRGIAGNNFAAFFVAEAMLQMWGYDVVNPARMDITSGKAEWNWQARDITMDNTFTIEEALDRDFKAILDGCVAVFVLPGWMNSNGALRETWLAMSTGRKVYAYSDNLSVDIRHSTDTEIKQEEHPYENHSA